MKNVQTIFAIGLLAAVASLTGCASTKPGAMLGPGDLAPPLAIKNWVQGDPVDSFEPGKVYVVEFWATWCGPCIAGMPHLAEVQKHYGDKVQVIGISSEGEKTVLDFLSQPHQSHPNMTAAEVAAYTIAVDDGRKTNQSYMEAAQQTGIPCAFVVGKDGKIAWIGHPAKIERYIEKALAK